MVAVLFLHVFVKNVENLNGGNYEKLKSGNLKS